MAPYDPEKHDRRSIRLKGYNYAQAGAYFVTLCVRDRECLFGQVIEGEVRLSDTGWVVCDAWEWLAGQYPHVEIDAWVVMPNHLHGIIVIHDGDGRGGSRTALKPLGRLIGAFKTVSTKRINELRHISGAPVWQRNYYEHIIRSERDLQRIREYIVANPARWAEDPENPVCMQPIGGNAVVADDMRSNRRGGSRTARKPGAQI